MCRADPERRTNTTCPTIPASHPASAATTTVQRQAMSGRGNAYSTTITNRMHRPRSSPKQCFQQTKAAKAAPLPTRRDGFRFSPREWIPNGKRVTNLLGDAFKKENSIHGCCHHLHRARLSSGGSASNAAPPPADTHTQIDPPRAREREKEREREEPRPAWDSSWSSRRT